MNEGLLEQYMAEEVRSGTPYPSPDRNGLQYVDLDKDVTVYPTITQGCVSSPIDNQSFVLLAHEVREMLSQLTTIGRLSMITETLQSLFQRDDGTQLQTAFPKICDVKGVIHSGLSLPDALLKKIKEWEALGATEVNFDFVDLGRFESSEGGVVDMEEHKEKRKYALKWEPGSLQEMAESDEDYRQLKLEVNRVIEYLAEMDMLKPVFVSHWGLDTPVAVMRAVDEHAESVQALVYGCLDLNGELQMSVNKKPLAAVFDKLGVKRVHEVREDIVTTLEVTSLQEAGSLEEMFLLSKKDIDTCVWNILQQRRSLPDRATVSLVPGGDPVMIEL